MNRKLASLSIAVILLLQLSGCSSGSDRAGTPGQDNTTLSSRTSAIGTNTNQTTGTAPAKTTTPHQKPLRFVVMADSRGSDKGINSEIVKEIMEKVKKLSPQPEFAIMPGDLCDGAKSFEGVKAQLEYFKKTVTRYYPIEFFYPGLGNHEVMNDSGGEKAFNEVFKEFKASFPDGYGRTVYYFDRGNTRFFMLNSNFPGERHIISDKQLEWVKKNLDPAKKHNLFFMHEPPFPTGSGVGNSLDSNRLQRDKLWDVIDNSTGPMVFCGHEHNYSRRHINSEFNETVNGTEFKYGKTIYQIVTGSFGAPLYTQYTSKKNVDVSPVSQYHYAVVDITGSTIKVNMYNLKDQTIDSLSQEIK